MSTEVPVGSRAGHVAPSAAAAPSPAASAGGAPAAIPSTSFPPGAEALRAALGEIVDKPSIYLVRAAQATTVRQVKAARKQLRDFNTTARVQLEGQLAALEAGASQLLSIRTDLDSVNEYLRSRKRQFIESYPHLRARLMEQQDVDDDDEEEEEKREEEEEEGGRSRSGGGGDDRT